MFDWDYISDTLFQPGGASAVVGRFLVQFFYSPAAALLITLACLCALAWLHRKQLPLIVAPLLFLLASLADYRLHFDVVAACLFASGGLAIWERSRRKVLCGILIPVALFLLAGSGAFLFAACALALSLVRGRWEGLVPVVAALLTGEAALCLNLVPTFGHTLSPVFFYDVSESMPGFHIIFWILIPLALLLSGLAGRFLKDKAAILVSGLLALCALPFAWKLFAKQGEDGAFNMCKYEYYAVRGQWAALEKAAGERLEYPVTANWYYLAKSCQGTLMRDLMKHRHNREYDLVFVPQDKSTNRALPFVMYRMGNYTSAQNISYNLLFSSCGYNPTLLKMQTDIELMRGNQRVADKYLTLLEKSLHYRKWAAERRVSDADIESGRRDFPDVQGFASPLYPMHALYAILRTNPSNRAAMEYGLAYLLLSKDIVNVAKFIEEFYGTEGLPELPVCAQEALAFFSDYQQNLAREDEFRHMDLGWCLSHGVQPHIISRMREFQNASLRSRGKAPQGFKGTYWHYFLYEDMMVNDDAAATDDKTAIY